MDRLYYDMPHGSINLWIIIGQSCAVPSGSELKL